MAHGHIQWLIDQDIKFIFYPSIAYERLETPDANNHFNCPVVASYPENIKNNVEDLQKKNVDFLHPFLAMTDYKTFTEGLVRVFTAIEYGFSSIEIISAAKKAWKELEDFKHDIEHKGEEVIKWIKDTAPKTGDSSADEFLIARVINFANNAAKNFTDSDDAVNFYGLYLKALAIDPNNKTVLGNFKATLNNLAIELASRYFITGDGTVCVPLPYQRDSVCKLPDETLEDFAKIERLWKYRYTDEYKAYIYHKFLENGGDPAKLTLPTSPGGWIEPK